jgi:hypothetical protein
VVVAAKMNVLLASFICLRPKNIVLHVYMCKVDVRDTGLFNVKHLVLCVTRWSILFICKYYSFAKYYSFTNTIKKEQDLRITVNWTLA